MDLDDESAFDKENEALLRVANTKHSFIVQFWRLNNTTLFEAGEEIYRRFC